MAYRIPRRETYQTGNKIHFSDGLLAEVGGGWLRPLAHIGLHPAVDETWRLYQVLRFANSAVESALMELAKGLARMGHVAVEPGPGHPHLRSG